MRGENTSAAGEPPPKIKDLLAERRARAEVYSKAHRRAAVRFERKHYWLGIPSTMMGAIVGTTIFGTIEKAASSWPIKVGLAAVSMTAACLVALQTFLRYLERSAQHNLAHAEYEDIAGAVEILSMQEKTRREWVGCLEGILQRFDAIKGRAPIPPDVEALELETRQRSDALRERVLATVVKKSAPEDDSLARAVETRKALPPSTAIQNAKRRPAAQHRTMSFMKQLRAFEAAPDDD